jgi:hypothetical protein
MKISQANKNLLTYQKRNSKKLHPKLVGISKGMLSEVIKLYINSDFLSGISNGHPGPDIPMRKYVHHPLYFQRQ